MPKKPVDEPKEFRVIEFDYTVKPLGNSGYVLIPKSLVGKKVRVRIENLD